MCPFRKSTEHDYDSPFHVDAFIIVIVDAMGRDTVSGEDDAAGNFTGSCEPEGLVVFTELPSKFRGTCFFDRDTGAFTSCFEHHRVRVNEFNAGSYRERITVGAVVAARFEVESIEGRHHILCGSLNAGSSWRTSGALN